jgi:tripeptide aminopeptidase
MGAAFDHELEDRFLRYVKIDTTADPTSPTSPSTQIQFGLLNLLMDELKEIGAQDVTLTGYGAVLASIPATVQVAAPTIALLAHVETAPQFPGKDVKPIVLGPGYPVRL